MSRNVFGPINWAMDVPPILLDNGRVDTDAHHVLLVLSTRAKPDGSDARPGLDWLARKSYRSVEATQRALDVLQAKGLISAAGDLNGTTVWQLHMNVVTHGRTVLDERQERARAANAERQRRHREKRAREAAGQVDVTPLDPVTEEPRNGGEGRYVTGGKGVTRNGVEGRYVTGGSNASNALEPRYVTGGTPSQPQVTPAVTALSELPLNYQEHTSSPAAPEQDPFERFWAVYPRKASKGGARSKFAAALKRAKAEQIIAGAERYAAERAADPRPDAKQWTKHPTTWLGNDCWDDEPAPHPLRAVSGGYQPYRNPTDQSIYDEDLT